MQIPAPIFILVKFNQQPQSPKTHIFNSFSSLTDTNNYKSFVNIWTVCVVNVEYVDKLVPVSAT